MFSVSENVYERIKIERWPMYMLTFYDLNSSNTQTRHNHQWNYAQGGHYRSQ